MTNLVKRRLCYVVLLFGIINFAVRFGVDLWIGGVDEQINKGALPLFRKFWISGMAIFTLAWLFTREWRSGRRLLLLTFVIAATIAPGVIGTGGHPGLMLVPAVFAVFTQPSSWSVVPLFVVWLCIWAFAVLVANLPICSRWRNRRAGV